MNVYLNKSNILSSLEKKSHKKLDKVKQVFKEKKLRIRYEKVTMSCEFCPPTMNRKINIMMGDTEVAHFELLGNLEYISADESSRDTVSLSIGIEDDFQGIQLSRVMMWSAILQLKKEEVNMEQYVYIDTDASVGFWDAIGMIPNESERISGTKGCGYEKKITLTNIEKWCVV
jgi:hypothetical protein